MRDHEYYVCIISSRSRTIYIGVTNNLLARLRQHREGTAHTFTKKYKIHRLVHYERFNYVNDAIAHEKYLKHFTPRRKDRIDRIHEPHVGRPRRRISSSIPNFLITLSSFREAGGPASVFAVVVALNQVRKIEINQDEGTLEHARRDRSPTGRLSRVATQTAS
jgi:putative endonuclease